MHRQGLRAVVFGRHNPVPEEFLKSYMGIYHSNFGEKTGPTIQEMQKDLLSEHGSIRPYIALAVIGKGANAQVVGGAFFVYSSKSRSFHTGMFCIDTALQRKRVGSFLFKKAEEQLAKLEPKARFITAESVAIRPISAQAIEPREKTIQRAKFWERHGLKRIGISGINKDARAEWDVRVKEIGKKKQAKEISLGQTARLLVDFHRNPLIHDYSIPRAKSFKISPDGKEIVRQIIGKPKTSMLRKKPKLPHM
ncbi:MAG: hypothetical protein PHH08_01805 [Candidatus ainarchaeum sp.]|nr:hypothetical protein [Candidatus ainarchaeum sp.]